MNSVFTERFKNTLPVLALLLATMFWGSSFITVGTALHSTDPVTLVVLRFAAAAALLTPVLGRQILRIPAATWKGGLVCGFVIFAAYACCAAGLITLQSSVSGFITALYVPLTPLMMWFVSGRRPSAAAFAGAILAFIGLIFLSNPAGAGFSSGFGEWITVASAVLSAVEIIVVGRYAPGTRARELAFTQLLSVALFGLLTLPLLHAAGLQLQPTVFTPALFFAVLWLAVISAFVQVLLSWAQRYVPPGRAAVIFAMESVFAAVIGWFAGEHLGWCGLLGGILIVSGILLGECNFKRKTHD